MIVIYGTVVEEDGVSSGRIKIEDNRIKSFTRLPVDDQDLSQRFPSCQLLTFNEYEGKRGLPEFLIFPGFVDLYARTPERLPALSGGVTSVIKYGTYVEPGDSVNFADCSNVIFNVAAKGSVVVARSHKLRSRIVISTVKELEAVQEAKEEGLDVLSEVHPINLYFDTSMVTPENERSLRSSPPIRSPDERKALFEAFAGGYVDIISSGHTPHDLSDKKSGVPELDTFGPMMAWLIEKGVPPEIIFKTACFNPASWVPGSTMMVGRIKQGYEANITVLAFNKPAIDGRQIYAKCGWSPYDLRHFRGSVETVILQGEKVVSGQWIKD